MRRPLAAAAVLTAVLAGTTACGGDSDSDAVTTKDGVTTIAITFEDGEVTPNGDRVEVEAGDPIDLEITADEPGEIHVHSDPEQEIEYEAGESTEKLVIDRPGVVEVESHTLDAQILSLEVK